MPSCARRNKELCWLLANVMDFKARNMMGSWKLVSLYAKDVSNAYWFPNSRYVTMIESFLTIASLATALVRSMVRRAEFFRCPGRLGASKRTNISGQQVQYKSRGCYAYGRCCRSSCLQGFLGIWEPSVKSLRAADGHTVFSLLQPQPV